MEDSISPNKMYFHTNILIMVDYHIFLNNNQNLLKGHPKDAVEVYLQKLADKGVYSYSKDFL